MPETDLHSLLEAYLFVAAEPVRPPEVAKALGVEGPCLLDRAVVSSRTGWAAEARHGKTSPGPRANG